MRLLQTQTILFMRLILPVLLSFGLFCASYAQQPDTLCTATVGELSAEVAALKAKTSAWDKVLAALPAISGYLQTGYEWSDNEVHPKYWTD